MKYLFFLSFMFLLSCSSKTDPLALPETLEEAISSHYRSSENIKRDVYRHPLKTLKFFGIKPDMTVIEISPGQGWYTEILAPFLRAEGIYVMAVPVTEGTNQKVLHEKMIAWKSIYSHIGNKMDMAIFSPPNNIKLPVNNSADMVLTFRNIHNWMKVQGAKEAFRAFYDVLKPGGILGIVEHRALPTQEDPFAKNGYVREQDVIEMAAQAGFKLVGTSEINANPNDTKNYKEGVWTLPPTLKLGEKDKDKYLAIGESDRMTLKFIKPKN